MPERFGANRLAVVNQLLSDCFGLRFTAALAETSNNGQLFLDTFLRREKLRCISIATLLSSAVLFASSSMALAADGEMYITIVDEQSGEPAPCRMSLTNEAGRHPLPKKAVAWAGQFIVPGEVRLRLTRGRYDYQIHRGLEYYGYTGDCYFIIAPNSAGEDELPLRRFVNMAERGWWSGDLDVRRPLKDMPLIMAAEDLHVAQVITWPDEKPDPDLDTFDQALQEASPDRLFHVHGGELKSDHGTAYCFGLEETPTRLSLQNAASDDESYKMMSMLQAIRDEHDVWTDVASPNAWDMPTLVANHLADSIQVLHGRLGRDAVIDDETGCKPREKFKYPTAMGYGRWSLDVYYKLLECGIRLPPSAGSGSGVLPNQVGSNRMYVKLDGEFSYEKWWEAFRMGRVVVTNGPILMTSVQGYPPGAVFHSDDGEEIELQIGMNISINRASPVSYIEIVKNGRVAHSIRLTELQEDGGRLPNVHFNESGWFLIRAVAEHPTAYRFAMTAPYYVEFDNERRVSREAAQFFLDWVYERARQVDEADPTARAAALQYHKTARDYFARLVEEANAD